MRPFNIGDIVKIKDEYRKDYCDVGGYADKPRSPYAVVLSTSMCLGYHTIGGKAIHLFPGDEKKYTVYYSPGEDKEDFCSWSANKFELLTNEISKAWRSFYELS